jgi:hypothetical protein
MDHSNPGVFFDRTSDRALPLFNKRNLLAFQTTIQKMKTTTSVAKYIAKNEMRKNAHWKFHGGKWFFEIAGIWLHEQSFDKFYPRYAYKRNRNENPDKTYVD